MEKGFGEREREKKSKDFENNGVVADVVRCGFVDFQDRKK